jgi:DNA-binding GntR family transcriptional regulator
MERQVIDLAKQLEGKGFRPQGLTRQISDLLTDLIMNGALKPGQQLVETELQKQLGISRSPLREAFRELEQKGLVVIVPRRGTFVREITRNDVEENFPVRACLEGLAARLAYPRMTREAIIEMGLALDNMKEAGRSEDRERYREAHSRFHDAFINTCGNQLLIDLLNKLRMQRLWCLITYRQQERNFRVSINVHQKIHDMFVNRHSDPQELDAVVRGHIDEALDSLFSQNSGTTDTRGK